MSGKLIPTADELRILREKISNIKDLYIFKSGVSRNMNVSHHSVGVGGSRNTQSRIGTFANSTVKEQTIKSSKDSNLNIQPNTKNEESIATGGLKNSHNGSKQMTLSYENRDEDQLSSNKFAEMQRFIDANKEKIETIHKYDELLKENEELKQKLKINDALENNQTFADILQDYIKHKGSILSLNNIINEKDKTIFELEKENRIFKEIEEFSGPNFNSSSNNNINYLKFFILSIINKNFDFNSGSKIISEIFNNTTDKKFDLVKFLLNRIESLEYQNYSLITKNENYSLMISNYIDELVEYLDVLSDITNVINQVNEAQTFTTEFMIIRDTLNKRGDYINSQKEELLTEREKIENEQIKEKNLQIVLCKDKIIEGKLKRNVNNNLSISANNSKNSIHIQPYNNKLVDIVDEKIEYYENLKNTLFQYEDFIKFLKEEDARACASDRQNSSDLAQNLKLKESLLNENYILKTKNIKMTQIISELLKNKDILANESLINDLNIVMNTDKDVLTNDDLFSMMRCQALLIETMQ
jgi:hypothetical protein